MAPIKNIEERLNTVTAVYRKKRGLCFLERPGNVEKCRHRDVPDDAYHARCHNLGSAAWDRNHRDFSGIAE